MHWAVRALSAFSQQQLEKTYGNLTPSRKEHIDRLQKQEDRIRSLAAEALALQLLQEHYDLTTAQLCRKENGQPYLTGCALFVSLSHSGQMVACAVGDRPVGIDVERIRPVKPNLMGRVCTAEELAYVLAGNTPSEGQPCEDPAVLRRFFEVWTGKEAYFKKCGTGITDFQAVNILTLPRQTHTEEDYLVQLI